MYVYITYLLDVGGNGQVWWMDGMEGIDEEQSGDALQLCY